MATVTYVPAEVVQVKPATVTMELSLDEAVAIHALVSHTRKTENFNPFAVADAIRKAGVDYYGSFRVTAEVEDRAGSPLLSVVKR